jgi:hypothetical protein
MLDGVAAGRVPEPDFLDPALVGRARVVLGLGPSLDAQTGGCVPIDEGATLDLEPGQAITINGGASIVAVIDDSTRSTPTVYPARTRQRSLVVRLPITVGITPLDAARPPELCT